MTALLTLPVAFFRVSTVRFCFVLSGFQCMVLLCFVGFLLYDFALFWRLSTVWFCFVLTGFYCLIVCVDDYSTTAYKTLRTISWLCLRFSPGFLPYGCVCRWLISTSACKILRTMCWFYRKLSPGFLLHDFVCRWLNSTIAFKILRTIRCLPMPKALTRVSAVGFVCWCLNSTTACKILRTICCLPKAFTRISTVDFVRVDDLIPQLRARYSELSVVCEKLSPGFLP